MEKECCCQRSDFHFQYPTFTDLDSAAVLFKDKGYIVVRNLFSADEVAQTCSEISKICTQWYASFLATGQEDQTANEIANRRPAWRNGSWKPEPGQEELGFRKLFRMTVQNEFFAGKAKHEKVRCMHETQILKFCCTDILKACLALLQIVPIVSRLLDSPDIKLVQSMCLLKPPGELPAPPTTSGNTTSLCNCV